MGLETGAFSTNFAKKKNWKLNEGLCRVLNHMLGGGQDRYDSMVDIGAGAGRYVQYARDTFVVGAAGFDATPGIEEVSGGLVNELDFTTPGAGKIVADFLGTSAQLAICIEVGEHIPEQHLDAFLDNVAASTHELLISWATKNQRGRDHVSCRDPEWVVEQFENRGFRYMDETAWLRELAGKGWDHKLLFLRSNV